MAGCSVGTESGESGAGEDVGTLSQASKHKKKHKKKKKKKKKKKNDDDDGSSDDGSSDDGSCDDGSDDDGSSDDGSSDDGGCDDGGCVDNTDCLVDGEVCDGGQCVPQAASVSGLVFMDMNGDGIRAASDTGLAGVGVNLYVDATGPANVPDGLPDNPGNPAMVTASDMSGQYGFAVNAYGTYVVGFQDLALQGLGYTLANSGSDDTVDSDVNQGTGFTTTNYNLQAGSSFANVSCGYLMGGGI